MIFQLLRSLLVITGTIIGVAIGNYFATEYSQSLEIENPQLTLSALAGFTGYLICSLLGRGMHNWVKSEIEKTNSIELAWSAMGLLLGLVSANLLLVPLYFFIYQGYSDINFDNEYLNSIIPLLHLIVPMSFNLLLAYLGVNIVLRYRKSNSKHQKEDYCQPKLLDTSAIIDGRFSELFRLGFLEGEILVPRFVINELQFLADSNEDLKRSRGREGLASLNTIKEMFPENLVLVDRDYADIFEVDSKLIQLAKDVKAVLLTQDYNLKKVAELDGIKALNINDLVNALKPIFVSGEKIEVKIVKKGKEETKVAFDSVFDEILWNKIQNK